MYQLSKSFKQGMHDTRILHNATYLFNQHSSVALTGVSGTGKSTLLHLLAGLETPTAGTVFFNETDISLFDAAQRQQFLLNEVGLIFQVPSLIDELSVIENVMIKGLTGREPHKHAYLKAQELLKSVGLCDKSHAAPRTLSGGEQQRVAIARALYTKPAFILADEPTAHLDAGTKKALIDLLLSCKKQWGAGLIIATHDELVAQRMDVILRLEKGTLTEVQPYISNESVVQPLSQM